MSSLLTSDDNTFHDKNDALTMHQSTVLWFECVKGGKEKRMSTRSIENGPVEAEIRLTLCHGWALTTLFAFLRKL
jgi:hypothetical protein